MSPRPKQRDRATTRQMILDAATEQFLEHGYSNTSLDEVASQAGFTKPTVYSHFQSKQGLFEAVTENSSNTRLAQLGEVAPLTGDPGIDLVNFGDFFLSCVMNGEAGKWVRLAASEAKSNPDVGRTFFRSGPARVLERLSELLQMYNDKQQLAIPDAHKAAEQLIGLFIGVDLLRSIIGMNLLNESQRRQRAQDAVEVFLAAYKRNSNEV